MAKTPDGVRGPGGPPKRQPSGNQSRSSNGASNRPSDAGQSGRRQLERRSYPILVSLTQVPRWLLVVFMAVCMVTGLMLSDGLAWLGAILLLVVAFFLAWLLALSWPLLSVNSKVLRLITVVALIGIAVLKVMGRF